VRTERTCVFLHSCTRPYTRVRAARTHTGVYRSAKSVRVVCTGRNYDAIFDRFHDWLTMLLGTSMISLAVRAQHRRVTDRQRERERDMFRRHSLRYT